VHLSEIFRKWLISKACKISGQMHRREKRYEVRQAFHGFAGN